MSNALFEVPGPVNEPVLDYAPGSTERESLKAALKDMAADRIEIPCVIDGKEVTTGNTFEVVMPHEHGHVLATVHEAGAKELAAAADAAIKARRDWERLEWSDRAAVFLKAAELLAGPWRDRLNASTMLGQSKTVYQAEIDAAAEMIDFFRFNAAYYEQILAEQPLSPTGVWNRMEYRPLEGFVLAITPFNFTSIAGNLPSAPALVGNVSVWKPAHTQMLSAWYQMQLFQEAGLPAGVINMVCAPGPLTSEVLVTRRDMAGIHFTGSTGTFQKIYRNVGEHIADYRGYPRLVGETGGKNFIFAHASADPEALWTALVRGAFEYQGQKCSAASRAYIPASLWRVLKQRLADEIKTIGMGDPRDFSNFMNAVIDRPSFDKISGYLDHAKAASGVDVLVGGNALGDTGWFIEPTVLVAQDPAYKSMVEEIFGPVLTVHVYEDRKLDEALEACDTASPYALTGAIFAKDRDVIARMDRRLMHTAGNFYINDKPTGAVVGQQPFGGARASGTNDKAGSMLNLNRWISPRTIKETFDPPVNYRYPFMKES
ncbi:MAG: L-glutamate gamma-semialdehyde dehydrogenase [Gammaproteobacteria bacterium]|nr:MAG: L-glutamate gamma-semialdehyde dehydrogenase [Gammaproteobacteria bacterium]